MIKTGTGYEKGKNQGHIETRKDTRLLKMLTYNNISEQALVLQSFHFVDLFLFSSWLVVYAPSVS